MECSVENLQLFFDGRLDPEAGVDLERHLHGCPACRAQLAGWARLDELLRTNPAPSRRRSLRPWALAATLAVLLGGSGWLYWRQPPAPGYVATVQGAKLLDCSIWVDGRRVDCRIQDDEANP